MQNMYLSMVEMERIPMCGFHTMISSIAAVPGVSPKYSKVIITTITLKDEEK